MELEQQIEGEALAGGEADSTSADTIETGEEQQSPRDYDAEAKRHGWTPKDGFKGDPAKWVDAETFVKRADEVMPFLKKQNDGLKREIDDLKKQFKQASKYFSKAEERAYERAMTDLQSRMDEAVESGDVAASRRVLKEMDDLKADAPPAPGAEKPEINLEAEGRKIRDWIEHTDWYGPDTAKTKYADEILVPMLGPAHEYEGGTEAWLAEIERRVERKFAPAKPNPVNGGGNRAAPGKGGKSFADLPPEAKKLCDKWVASGIVDSREAYVKGYDWS